jgi:hypothetical protein
MTYNSKNYEKWSMKDDRDIINEATFSAVKNRFATDLRMWALMWLFMRRTDWASFGIAMPNNALSKKSAMENARQIVLNIEPTTIRVFAPVQVEPKDAYKGKVGADGKELKPELAMLAECFDNNVVASENYRHLSHSGDNHKISPFLKYYRQNSKDLDVTAMMKALPLKADLCSRQRW